MPKQIRVPNSDISPPGGGGGIINDLARKLKNRACELYQNVPEAIVPNPASNFLRRHWNDFCNDVPDFEPPFPPPPFGGGQCGEIYHFDYSITIVRTNCTNTNTNGTDTGTGSWTKNTLFGPIRGYRAVAQANQGAFLYVDAYDNFGVEKTFFVANLSSFAGCSIAASGFINNVRKADASPDECGDPPGNWDTDPPYDPDNPPVLPPIDFPPPLNPLPGNDFNFSIPLVYAPTDLTIKPTFDLGGIGIEIDIEGINFNFPDNDDFLPPDLDGLPDQLPEFPDIPDYQDELDTIDDKLDELLLPEEEEEEPAPPNDIEVTWLEGSCEEGEFTETEFNTFMQPSLAGDFIRQKEILYNLSKEACALEKTILETRTVTSIPEWWQTVLNSKVPQLVAVFRREGTRTYYQLAIPHPSNIEPSETPLISAYRAGDYMAQLTLRDNSKFICYCESEDTANRVLDEAIALIDSSWQNDPIRRRVTKTQGYSVHQDLRIPSKNSFFEEGNRTLAPTWERKINQEEEP